jgi:hypothetical protein
MKQQRRLLFGVRPIGRRHTLIAASITLVAALSISALANYNTRLANRVAPFAPHPSVASFNDQCEGVTNVHSFGAKGDGRTDDTRAIQAAIDATLPAGLLRFPNGTYRFRSLRVIRPITLEGTGWSTVVTGGRMGDHGWLGPGSRGSILRSTVTDGAALTLGSLTTVYAFNIRDLALIGPGTGASVGIALGSPKSNSDRNNWNNVLVANFSVGAIFVGVEDSTFIGLRFQGDGFGLKLLQNSTANTFVNAEFVGDGFGLFLSGAALNTFLGGDFQADDTAVWILANAESIAFESIWFEQIRANAFNLETTDHYGITNFSIIRTRSSGPTVGPFIYGHGRSSIRNLKLESNEWGMIPISIPANAVNAVLLQNDLTLIDRGRGTRWLDGPGRRANR